MNAEASPWGLTPQMLDTAFPFHLVLDRDLAVRQAGPSIAVLCPGLVLGSHLRSAFELVTPKIALSFGDFQKRGRSLVLLRTSSGVLLRGQMLHDAASPVLIFVGSPWLTDGSALRSAGLTLNHFAASDPLMDYLLLFQQQVRALAQAQQLAAALASSEQRTRHIIQTANDAFIELDSAGVVRGWNSRAELMFGWRRAEALGRSVEELIVPAELRAHHREGLLGMLAAASSGESVLAREGITRRKDGAAVPVEVAIWQTWHEGRQSIHLIARDITERRDAERRTRLQANRFEHQALLDPLTGLPNRALLHDRLGHALAARDRSVNLLLLDLDDFKLVNDVSGHAAGDELLVEVASRLSVCVREGDTVARLGGDEFAVVVRGSDPSQLAARILDRLADPVAVAGRQIVPLASIGIADGAEAADLDELLLHADVAMYAAKHHGKGRVERFTATMAQAIRTRADLQDGLRRAVSNGEIVVHFQPVIEVRTGSVSRLEALARWQRGGNLVAPADFFGAPVRRAAPRPGGSAGSRRERRAAGPTDP